MHPLGSPLMLLVAALAGSFHCAGMCGGFAAAVGGMGAAPASRARLTGNLLLYLGGKGVSYAVLGTLAGSTGLLWRENVLFAGAQQLLAVGAGALMVGVGLSLLGVWGLGRGAVQGALAGLWRSLVSPYLSGQVRGGALYVGMFNGVLPCPLVYAFLGQAVMAGSPMGGALVMGALAAGSAPTLVAAGIAGRRVRGWHPLRSARVAGALLTAFGAVTALRGTLPWLALPGHGGALPF